MTTSDGFLVQAVDRAGFWVKFSTAKIIFGMLLALAIGFTTAEQLRGTAEVWYRIARQYARVLIGPLPVWIIVVLCS